MTKQSLRGFTLVELMVVVAIIVIVAMVVGSYYSLSPERKKLEITAKQLFSLVQDARFFAITSGRAVQVVGIGNPLTMVISGRDQNNDGTLTPPDAQGGSPDFIRKAIAIPHLMRNDPGHPEKKLTTVQFDTRGLVRGPTGEVTIINLEFCEVAEGNSSACLAKGWRYKLMTSPVGLPRED